MNEDFEDQLRRAIHNDEMEIRSDTERAIRTGRRIVRGRRIGWGLAASAVVVAGALGLPGLVQRTLPAQPVETVLATPSPAPATLIGTRWEVLKLDGADLIPGTSITLNFGDGRIDGFGGCNQYGHGEVDGKVTAGWYRQDGDRLAIGAPASNAKDCLNGIGDQKATYVESLIAAQSFAIASDRLQLFGADGAVLVELERAPVKLERTGWQVVSINGAAPVAERPPTLLFRDGGIHVATGCNGISGSYSQDGDRLRMTGMGTSLMLCQEQAIMQQEEAVSGALDRVKSAVVEGSRLHLRDAAGATLLEAIPDSALVLRAERSTWRLDNSSGLWGKDGQTSITLRVDDGRLSGRNGCGTYSAGFRHHGDTWTVTNPTHPNPVPCPNTTAASSERFLSLLVTVTRVELVDNQLRLITPTEPLLFTRD